MMCAAVAPFGRLLSAPNAVLSVVGLLRTIVQNTEAMAKATSVLPELHRDMRRVAETAQASTWKLVDVRTLTLPFVPYWSQFSRYAVQSAAPLCQAGVENVNVALPVGEVNTAFHPSRTRLPFW